MTTIVWDGRFLAADRQWSRHDGSIVGYRTKFETFERPDNTGHPRKYAVVCSGTEIDTVKFARWCTDKKMLLAEYPKLDESFQGLVLVEKGKGVSLLLFLHDSEGVSLRMDQPFAIGCEGRSFAEGCLAMGANAPRAVLATSRFCVWTGGGVEFVDSQGDISQVWRYCENYAGTEGDPHVVWDGRSWDYSRAAEIWEQVRSGKVDLPSQQPVNGSERRHPTRSRAPAPNVSGNEFDG